MSMTTRKSKKIICTRVLNLEQTTRDNGSGCGPHFPLMSRWNTDRSRCRGCHGLRISWTKISFRLNTVASLGGDRCSDITGWPRRFFIQAYSSNPSSLFVKLVENIKYHFTYTKYLPDCKFFRSSNTFCGKYQWSWDPFFCEITGRWSPALYHAVRP